MWWRFLACAILLQPYAVVGDNSQIIAKTPRKPYQAQKQLSWQLAVANIYAGHPSAARARRGLVTWL